MKTRWMQMSIFFLLIGLMTAPAFAFDSGSTGALGAFSPTSTTTVQLPPDGILNYTTVNIPSGVGVSFIKNTANTPVYILATGDVTISGSISVGGNNGSGIYPGKGGPGGYDGGYGGLLSTFGTNGQGPNGGGGGTNDSSYYGKYGYGGGGGSINTNDRVVPTVGGSGGGGGAGGYTDGTGGGGAGGAGGILIASSGKVTITGGIYANGGGGGSYAGAYGGGGGGGSAGTIRIIANTMAGDGTIQALGGSGGTGRYYSGGNASNGRIRLEFNTSTRTAATNPVFTFDIPGQVFYNSAFPLLSIVSIGGVAVPTDPKADYINTDIILPSSVTPPVAVVVSASNIPAGTTVTVRAIPQYATTGSVTATALLDGTDVSSTATASLSISTTRTSIIAASATFNLTVASNGEPLYAEGEKVVKMRVDAELNKKSSVTYITETGREILAMNK